MENQDQLLNTIIEWLKQREQQSVSNWNMAQWYLNNVMQRKVLWQASNNELAMAQIRWGWKKYTWYEWYKVWNKPMDYNYWNTTKSQPLATPYTGTDAFNKSQSQLNSINTPKF